LKGRALSQEDVTVINQRNAELVSQLRTIDSAFSLGESGNGQLCYDFFNFRRKIHQKMAF
jgi:hypothetical protein